MSWLTDIFSSTASGVIDSVGNAIDKMVTSDAEKLELKNQLEKIRIDALERAEQQAIEADKEITKRWQSDNEHIITRLVRPLAYAWVVVMFTFIAVGDGNLGFEIKAAYVSVFETLLSIMTVAYFGSRGYEKVQKMRGKQ